MRLLPLAGTLAFVALMATPGDAQQPTGAHQPPQAKPVASQPETPPPSAESMGVSLKAIRNQLKQAPAPTERSSGSGLRYDFIIDVMALKPPIDYFKDFDLSTKGGVRWGAPTHQEVLNAMSPYWVSAMRPVGSGVDLLAAGRKKK